LREVEKTVVKPLATIDAAKLHAMIRAACGVFRNAPVAELVDALDSKSSSARSAGSIPARGTKYPSKTVQYRPERLEKPRKILGLSSKGVRWGALVSVASVGTIVVSAQYQHF
jgi:hypothetical protein